MPGVNKVLYNLDQRGETTPEERTTARRNIDAISADEVAVLFDDHYKVKQSPINMTFAANAVLRRLYQNANGEIGAECNYIYNATQDTAGLMSPYDKAKLDGIAYGRNRTSRRTGTPLTIVSTRSSAISQIWLYSSPTTSLAHASTRSRTSSPRATTSLSTRTT